VSVAFGVLLFARPGVGAVTLAVVFWRPPAGTASQADSARLWHDSR
jgi:hypothetical protein